MDVDLYSSHMEVDPYSMELDPHPYYPCGHGSLSLWVPIYVDGCGSLLIPYGGGSLWISYSSHMEVDPYSMELDPYPYDPCGCGSLSLWGPIYGPHTASRAGLAVILILYTHYIQ